MKLLIFALIAFPWVGFASELPENCKSQLFQGEVPIVSPTQPDAKLICYTEFTLLHSSHTKTPVWVAEHLTSQRVEAKVRRKDAFHSEKSLPKGERAELSDYVHSGYARGHMAPSGDMSTPEAQRESFSLANMVPQNSRNNSGPWKGIEDSVRTLAENEQELFVVTGPIYLSPPTTKTIGNGVEVPDKLFKAVYDPRTRQAGAYVVTNEAKPTCEEVSIKGLNVITNIDVFPTLSVDVKSKITKLPVGGNLVCPQL